MLCAAHVRGKKGKERRAPDASVNEVEGQVPGFYANI